MTPDSIVISQEVARKYFGGGPAVGKSAAMSANPELQDKPDELSALVKIVRDFRH